MTVARTTNLWSDTGNGSTDGFAYDNVIFAASDMKVYLDGALQSSGYSVSGIGSVDGGNVTFDTPPAAGVSVVLVRDVPYTQPEAHPSSGSFKSATANRAYDRLCVLVQQVLAAVNGALRLGPSDPSGSIGTLPDATTRALKVLSFDSSGDPVAGDKTEWRVGSGTPADSLGNDGDLYLDGAGGDVYGPKASGAWGAAVASLAGPAGPAGPAGADGIFAAIASPAEAEAGAENTKGMTALRTKQAIDAQAAAADQTARDMALSAQATAFRAIEVGGGSMPASAGAFELVDNFADDTLGTKTGATWNAGGRYYGNGGLVTGGSAIGDMTGNGGLAAAIDGTVAKTAASSAMMNAGGTAEIGIALPASDTIERIVVNAPTDDGFIAGPTAGTMTFEHSANGESWSAFPESATITATSGQEIDQTVTPATNGYVRAIIDSGDNKTKYCAQIRVHTQPGAMTLAPAAAATVLAGATAAVALFVFDPVDAVTFGTHVTGRLSIDNGATWATGTWTKLGAIGSGTEELWALKADVSAQTGTQLDYEIGTAAGYSIHFHDSVGVVAF